MTVFNRIYGATECRSFWRRLATSVVLALAVSLLVLLAIGVVEVLPRLASGHGPWGTVVSIGRWPVGVALGLTVAALLLRYAPARQRPWHWVSFGSVLSVGGWLVASAAFAWYLTSIARYGSIFGALATVIVVMTYLYL